MIAEGVVPVFARGTKLRFDGVRDAWVVLAPERAFQPDEHAVAVLQLVDGKRDFRGILDDLSAKFNAPREVLAEDVSTMLEDLSARGVLKL